LLEPVMSRCTKFKIYSTGKETHLRRMCKIYARLHRWCFFSSMQRALTVLVFTIYTSLWPCSVQVNIPHLFDLGRPSN
jgi:hypothetical protein